MPASTPLTLKEAEDEVVRTAKVRDQKRIIVDNAQLNLRHVGGIAGDDSKYSEAHEAWRTAWAKYRQAHMAHLKACTTRDFLQLQS